VEAVLYCLESANVSVPTIPGLACPLSSTLSEIPMVMISTSETAIHAIRFAFQAFLSLGAAMGTGGELTPDIGAGGIAGAFCTAGGSAWGAGVFLMGISAPLAGDPVNFGATKTVGSVCDRGASADGGWDCCAPCSTIYGDRLG